MRPRQIRAAVALDWWWSVLKLRLPDELAGNLAVRFQLAEEYEAANSINKKVNEYKWPIYNLGALSRATP
jgi:hypothetical protein